MRYKRFIKRTNTTACKLVDLPPTKEAANLHIARVYLQIQKWVKNNYLKPEKFGWQITAQGYLPMPLPKGINPLPDSLLQSISCKCASGCKTKACSCRKVGLNCSPACAKCGGIDCTNVEEVLELTEVEDDINFHETEENIQSDSQDTEEVLSDDYSFTTDYTIVQEESDNLLFRYESSDSDVSSDDSSDSRRKRKRNT